MKQDPSLQNRFARVEQAFSYSDSPASFPHAERLAAVRAGLPPLSVEAESDAGEELLARRAEHLSSALRPLLAECMEALALQALQADHAFTMLFAHTRLLDALHALAFQVALEELPLLLEVRRQDTARELASRRDSLPRRREKLVALEAEVARPAGFGSDDADGDDAAHRDYLRQVAAEQRAELTAAESTVRQHEEALPALEAFDTDAMAFAQRIVLFARGGYGRAEMSFSSDIDTGYCLNVRGLAAGQAGVYHDFVMRVERLLRTAGLEPAHQFFELDEDLSRFADPETLHTIPSILEARALAGNAKVLTELQGQFRAMLPFELIVRNRIEQFEDQREPGYTSMDLKSDFGGLRSIQIPLWLLGIAHEAPSFMTLDLLRLARNKGMLSEGEETRLLLALECLYELRNFVGAAERYYYDREARESGFHVQGFPANRVDDHVARLYLFRKQRFPSIDAFDTYRLRRVEDVQRIARRLLERVLDRTLVHELGAFRVSVHLGHKQIIAVESTRAGAPADLGALFTDAEAVLSLLAYVAATGYGLTSELKDALGAIVEGLRTPQGEAGRARQAALLSELMGAPMAHRALETMFEVSDPLAPGVPSLVGRFIPAFDGTVFLLRRFEGQTLPLHEHILRSLARGEAELVALKRGHPELFDLLRGKDVLALKWSLLLQGLGRLEAGPLRTAQTAEQAAGVLAALGYGDPELERGVRLLIEHHATVAALARSSTYMDQALAQYFEIAGRDLVNVTLLYLVNLAVLQAHGGEDAADVAALRHLFTEANAILGEMRGFPVQERSLEVINLYFDRKKEELIADTRLYLLLQTAIARGLKAAVYEPLQRAQHPAWERVQRATTELAALYREIKLGVVSPGEEARLAERLLQALRNHLGREAIPVLTAEHDELLSWFFSAFANRYLLGSLPSDLAAQMAKFAHFREAEVIADVVAGPSGASEGLLIYIRGLSRPHTRVAYAMSRHRVNIGSGKVNPVALGNGEQAYCYFFQISTLDSGERLIARDLELMIATESPPELAFPERGRYQRSAARVEFQGNDGKGYRVVSADGQFERRQAEFEHLRLVLRDEPYLFYKVSRAFDLFDVEVQQALITTIGNQVVDYFYLNPADYERLQASSFEEVLISLVNSDLLAVAR
ncbi:MAG TPA: hypothetical protein VKB51_16180 [bacterium]|nr:hypothetical protein [bacterium]